MEVRVNPYSPFPSNSVRVGTAEEDRPWRTIVGVAPDVYMQGVGNSDGEPHGFYIPLAQQDARFVTIAVRGRGDPLALASTVREEVAVLHLRGGALGSHGLPGHLHGHVGNRLPGLLCPRSAGRPG